MLPVENLSARRELKLVEVLKNNGTSATRNGTGSTCSSGSESTSKFKHNSTKPKESKLMA